MAELLESVESNVLDSKGEEPLDFRDKQMEQCSMTGVAAALIAQVANTTLQLQYMSTIHWTIPSLCTCSLILGLLSVYYSFQLHYSLANFTSADYLRAAFTRSGAPVRTRGGNEGVGAWSEEGGGERRGRGGGGEGGEGAGVETPGQLEAGSNTKDASYQATFMLWLPFSLLRLAIYFYLVAIVSYWGVAAEMDIQESRARSTIVGFLFLTPSFVFRANHQFLGLWIHLVGIVIGSIPMVLGGA